MSTAFTFNKEKKARKHLEYAKERVAEMSEVLKGSSAKLDDIAKAKADFDERVADAAAIVKGEKEKGSDVAKLARELDDELDISRDALKDVFGEHKGRSSRAEEEIRAKLAALPADAPQIHGLTQALAAITKEKDEAKKEEDDLDIDLMDEQELFEEVMGKEMAAQKHMEQAMRLQSHLEEVAGRVPSQASEQLMKQAQEAMQRGDFDVAKQMSKDAERAFEKVREIGGIFESGSFEVGMPVVDDGMGVDDMDVNDLEQEIKKGERMMEGFDGDDR